MTLDELVDAAREELDRSEPAANYVYDDLSKDLASGILDLFAEADPCGFEAPLNTTIPAGDPSWVRVPRSWGDAVVTPDDARALARALFRCADEADEENEKNAIRAALASSDAAKTTAPSK